MLVSFAVPESSRCSAARRGPRIFLRWTVICGPFRILLGQVPENAARFDGLTADQIAPPRADRNQYMDPVAGLLETCSYFFRMMMRPLTV
jgi:hypothetical protein